MKKLLVALTAMLLFAVQASAQITGVIVDAGSGAARAGQVDSIAVEVPASLIGDTEGGNQYTLTLDYAELAFVDSEGDLVVASWSNVDVDSVTPVSTTAYTDQWNTNGWSGWDLVYARPSNVGTHLTPRIGNLKDVYYFRITLKGTSFRKTP